MRHFAEWLFDHEAAAATHAQANVPVAFRVCEKLRRPLTTLAGAVGFHSLLSRALTLAQREVPSLSAVRINEDGSLERSGEVELSLDAQAADGEIALVADLLGLLFTFIGKTLTLRLIHDVWPDAAFDALNGEGAAKHEPQG